jgi:hypothetical protein
MIRNSIERGVQEAILTPRNYGIAIRIAWKISFRSVPEGAGLSDFCHGGYHFPGVFPTLGNPIQIHPPSEVGP